MWDNSLSCVGGYFHDYQIIQELPIGLVEACKKCKSKKFFPNNIPSNIYLSYHLKQTLQPYHKRFIKHYGQFSFKQ